MNRSFRRAGAALANSSWFPLVAAALLFPFSNGVTPIPLAAWLAPAVLLRFVRTRRKRVGLPTAFAVLAAAALVEFRGMVPGAGAGASAVGMSFAAIAFVPYAVDRLVAARLGAVAGTLVFPSAWVATEYLLSLTPGATWGSVAYTQYGELPLLQMLALTGLWGLTFLIGWFASVSCLVWDEGWGSRPARSLAIAFAATVSLAIVLGQVRMASCPPTGPTVRVASFSQRLRGTDLTRHAYRRLGTDHATAADLGEIRAREGAVNDSLLVRAGREAGAGAKIIFWSEGNARAFKEDEAAWIGRAREVAKAGHVYLGVALSTWSRGLARPRENKILLIAPTGEVAWQYLKAHPVPFAESRSRPGDGVMPSLDTPFGRLTSAICYDADFPGLIAQAGARRADIVLDPADDWRAIDPLHTRMASFRAIEQGVNLVRQTSNGRSAAYDYLGDVLAEADDFRSPDGAMVAQLPVRGVHTLYSLLGDWFAWSCLGALAWSALRALRAGAR